ncbi:MAG: acylphosphatase [Planctomycetota bacterium]
MAEEDERARAEVVIDGRVQGVFFRATTRQHARELNVTGWVRNRRDGRVEAVFEGRRSDVRKIVSWCHKGPNAARVESVDVDWKEPTGEFGSFRVRH